MKYMILVGVLVLLLGHAHAGEGPTLTGAIAYTEIIRFDYSQNGKINNVQFWLEFDGKGAVGTEGDPDYQPAEGSIYYFLLDVGRGEKVRNWLVGFGMMRDGLPPSGPYPMTNIVFDGKTVRFEAFQQHWVIIDGGPGFEYDQVLVDDGFKPKPLKLYGGNLTVTIP